MTKRIRRFAILGSVVMLMLIADMTPQLLWLPSDIQVMSSDAQAVAGRQRRTRRRGVAVGYSAGKQAGAAEASSASASEQQATTEQQQPAEQQQAAAPQTAAAPAPASTGALPLGSIVEALPEGCTKKTVDGVQYYHDGTNYYRAAFQGNELVYVTAQP